MRYRQEKIFVPGKGEAANNENNLFDFYTVAFKKHKLGSVGEHIDIIKYVIKDALECGRSGGSLFMHWATDLPNMESGLEVPNAYHIGFERRLDIIEQFCLEDMFEKYRKNLKLGTKKVFLRKGIINGSFYMYRQSGAYGKEKIGLRKRHTDKVRRISNKYN